MEEEFQVYIEFTYGNESMIERCKESKLSNTIDRLLNGPFAMMGGIKGFKIVDMLDLLVMEVINGKIVFPEQEDQ